MLTCPGARHISTSTNPIRVEAGHRYRAHPELYRVGRGEQGVLICRPYKDEIAPLWRFKTPDEAEKSSAAIEAKFKDTLMLGISSAPTWLGSSCRWDTPAPSLRHLSRRPEICRRRPSRTPTWHGRPGEGDVGRNLPRQVEGDRGRQGLPQAEEALERFGEGPAPNRDLDF